MDIKSITISNMTMNNLKILKNIKVIRVMPERINNITSQNNKHTLKIINKKEEVKTPMDNQKVKFIKIITIKFQVTIAFFIIII